MSVPDVDGVPAGAIPGRRDGWIVTSKVQVLFDTNNARTRYDQVGTLAQCTCCGEDLNLARSTAAAFGGHARTHERRLSMEHPAGAVSHRVAVASVVTQTPSGQKEVRPTPTPG